MSSFDEGMQAFNKKDFLSAINLFLQATKEDEKNHKAWNALGVTLVKTHQYEDADFCFKVAIELSPGNGTYIRNQLANRSKIPLKRSPIQIIRLEIDQLIHVIKTRKIGPLIALSLAVCVISFLIATIGSRIINQDPYISQIGLIVGLWTGFVFIFLVYGEQIIKSLSTLSRVLLVLGIITGAIIISYVILNPSVLPLGNTNQSSEMSNRSLVNLSHQSPNEYSTQQPVGSSSDQSSVTSGIQGECKPPKPAIIYTINEYDPFTVTFSDQSPSSTPNTARLWNFGDGKTSTDIKPTHTYQSSPVRYLINYTIENPCGRTNTTLVLDPQCNPLNPDFAFSLKPEGDQQIVQFNDNSSSLNNITSWRWIFGDGTSFYTTDPSKRDCTHLYRQDGTYQVSLVVENNCNQEYPITKQVSTVKIRTISGIIWEDTNRDSIRDPNEQGLSNWEVFLEENVQDGWTILQRARTNQTGVYVFTVSENGGLYRIRESAPDLSWRNTNPSNPNYMNTSPLFSLKPDTPIGTINFGNIKLKTDKTHKISLQTSRNGTITAGGYMNWLNLGAGTVSTGTDQYHLSDNSQCTLFIPSDVGNASIIINSSSQEFSGLNGTLKSEDLKIPASGNISISVPTTLNYNSNLHLRLNAEKSSYVNLVVDGNVIPVNWRQTIEIFDLMPSAGTQMLLTMSGNETIFIGQASDYSIT